MSREALIGWQCTGVKRRGKEEKGGQLVLLVLYPCVGQCNSGADTPFYPGENGIQEGRDAISSFIMVTVLSAFAGYVPPYASLFLSDLTCFRLTLEKTSYFRRPTQ